jgi:hypothetical protein
MGVGTAFDDPADARQGQGQEALDLAQPAALASTSVSLSNLGLNLAFGTGNSNSHNTTTSGKAHNVASSSSTIRMHHHNSHHHHHHLAAGGMGLNKPSQLLPSDTFGSVAAAIAAANAVGRESSGGGGGGLNALDLIGTGTIRPSHFKSGGGVGRSASHHRGQSAVCPQELDLSNDGKKRKRLSWDGGLV